LDGCSESIAALLLDGWSESLLNSTALQYSKTLKSKVKISASAQSSSRIARAPVPRRYETAVNNPLAWTSKTLQITVVLEIRIIDIYKMSSNIL
jgi:hypothetical protein